MELQPVADVARPASLPRPKRSAIGGAARSPPASPLHSPALSAAGSPASSDDESSRSESSSSKFFIDDSSRSDDSTPPAIVPRRAQSILSRGSDDDDDDDIGGFADQARRRLSKAVKARETFVNARKTLSNQNVAQAKPVSRAVAMEAVHSLRQILNMPDSPGASSASAHMRPDGRNASAQPARRTHVAVVAMLFLARVRVRIRTRNARKKAVRTPKLTDKGSVVPLKWLTNIAQPMSEAELEKQLYEEYKVLQGTQDSAFQLTWFEQLAVDYPLWAFVPLLFLTVMIYALRSGYDDDREL